MPENESGRSDVPVWRSWPFLVGYCLTIVFIVFWAQIALTSPSSVEECTSNLCVFLRSRPNEIGDTFAGLFGSLAFVWIIVTVLVQGLELREQRIEIKAGREAQESQAQALALQAGVLANQNIALQEQRNDRFVEALISSIKQSVNDLKGPLMTWKIKYYEDENLVEKEIKPFEEDALPEDRFLRFSSNLISLRSSLLLGGDWMSRPSDPTEVEIVSKPVRSHIHQGLLDYLEKVGELREKCSVPMQLEIQRLALPQFQREYFKIMDFDEFWNGDFDPKDHYDPDA